MRKGMLLLLFVASLPLLAQTPESIIIPVKTPSFELGYGSCHTEDLGIKPYDLQVVPGGFNDGLYLMTFNATNYFPKYPGYYEAKLLVGTHELCNTERWGTERTVEMKLVCSAPQYIIGAKWPNPDSPTNFQPFTPSSPDDHLILSFCDSGWQVLFDKTSVSFMPQ